MSDSSSYLTSPVVGASSPLGLASPANIKTSVGELVSAANTKTIVDIAPSANTKTIVDIAPSANTKTSVGELVSAAVAASAPPSTVTSSNLSTAEYWRMRFMELEKEREAEKMQLASAAASGGVPLSDISNVVMDIMSANPVMVMRTAPAPNMNVSSGALLSMSGASNTNVSSGALLTTDNKIDYLVSGMRHLLSFTLPASNASGSSSGATTTWGMNSGLFTPVKMPPEPEEEEEEEEPENNNNIVPAPAPAPNVTVENDEETEDMGSNSGPTTGGGRRTRNRKNKNKKKKRTRRSKH